MYDVFVANLQCPGCSAVASVNDNTAMQTHVRCDADGAALGVGFQFEPNDLETEDIVRGGYLLVSPPVQGKPIRLLEVWICPSCQTEQWAAITIDDNCIQDIEAVRLDGAALRAANFISEVNAELLAEHLAGLRTDVVETLRRILT
jgi:hypothetical protein